MTESKLALVLGATGGIGGAVTEALVCRGWRVRALTRRQAHPRTGVEWRQGDAMNRADIVGAAQGTSLIVHAVNPPGYRNWRGLALPMLANTIAAAEQSGARIVFPGNVYNFSPDALPLVSESSPQRPLTKKGAIRVEMEESLREAAARGAKVLIVRAGDFYGPGATARNSWLAGALVKPNRPVTRITYPGPPDTGHAWAYLPDMAETVMRLIERDAALPGFAVFHFGGHWFDNGTALADAIRAASGNPDIPLGRLPWWLVKAVAPFHETFREMLEMRYLWEVPLRLDNGRLVDFLGSEPHTPTEEAIRATLRALGCLDRSADVDADLAGGQRRVGAQRQVNA